VSVLAAALPRARPLEVLWRFSRPHTVIGTTLSVLGLFAIAVAELPRPTAGEAAVHLGFTLLAALCVNVFIVGVNQLTDVEIDRINKPFLPLAAGDLGPHAARVIVAVAAAAPVALALTQGAFELAAVLAGLAVGVAYSVPPLRLKRFPALASLSISGVRALVVNLGVYGHFALAFAGTMTVAASVWALTAFVLPFAFAIAVLKDVPDLEGDRRHRIATFTVRLGPERAFKLGLSALVLAYVGMIAAAPWIDDAQPAAMAAGHAAALLVLWRLARGVDPRDPAGFTRFYMRVWALFFLEYVLVPAAVIAA
jgi:homogentisate phytyltransferase/homogentisate geranylgeranyltransferase